MGGKLCWLGVAAIAFGVYCFAISWLPVVGAAVLTIGAILNLFDK